MNDTNSKRDEHADGGEESDRQRTKEFTVDGVAFTTTKRELTAAQVMEIAGLDPATHYLTLVKERKQTRLANDEVIKIRDGMTFVSASTEPTPTS